MSTATEAQPRCGSTDTEDGSPCSNMVSDPDERCGHHAEDEDADAGDGGSVMSRDQWERSVQETKDELGELRTRHRDLQKRKEKALATIPQDQQQLDELDEQIDRTRDLIERAEARLETLQGDVKDRMEEAEAEARLVDLADAVDELTARYEDAREELEDVRPRFMDALESALVIPALQKAIQVEASRLAEHHGLSVPDLDLVPLSNPEYQEIREIDLEDVKDARGRWVSQRRHIIGQLSREKFRDVRQIIDRGIEQFLGEGDTDG